MEYLGKIKAHITTPKIKIITLPKFDILTNHQEIILAQIILLVLSTCK